MRVMLNVCAGKTNVLLYVVYVISILTALANPAHLNFEEAYRLAQGANITMLLLLAYCRRSVGVVFVAAVLGVAFAMRSTGAWTGGSRWDSLLVTVGMLIVLQRGFNQALPSFVRHRRILYLLFSLVVFPVLAALPHLLQPVLVDEQTMRQAMHFSASTYNTPREKLLHEPSTDTTAGVMRVGSTVYVFFEGSNSATDWRNNINILEDAVPEDWACDSSKRMRTHKGYTIAFKSVQDRVMRAVQAELSAPVPTDRLVVTGHSLGGAMATMAGLLFACKMPEVRDRLAVVTFGAPQVGDGNFVAHFDRVVPASVRVVNPMDPVPRLLSAQLVHVKGYVPVGAFTLESMFPYKSHMPWVYADALDQPRWLAVAASFMPAVFGAILIFLWIAWQFKNA